MKQRHLKHAAIGLIAAVCLLVIPVQVGAHRLTAPFREVASASARVRYKPLRIPRHSPMAGEVTSTGMLQAMVIETFIGVGIVAAALAIASKKRHHHNHPPHSSH